jgi:CHAT domain-containing protein/tetratricopeptide (TPR) repeat protein
MEPLGEEAAELRSRGNRELAAGRVAAAGNLYRQSYEVASRRGLPRECFKALNNYSLTLMIRFRYQEALESCQQGKALAYRFGDREDKALFELSLAGVYFVIGDVESSAHEAEESMRLAGSSNLHGRRCELLYCLAMIREKQGRPREALAYFQEAIFAADNSSRTDLVAKDWDLMGEELMLHGDLSSAERAFVEAFRLRSLFRDRDIRVSLMRLSWVRLEQGDIRSARALMDRARSLPASDMSWPIWLSTYVHGRILQAAGQNRAALNSFREALISAREYQTQGAPDGIPIEYAQLRLKRLYYDVVKTSLAVDKLGLDALQATEEDRAAALRQTVIRTAVYLKKTPPEYWSTLEQLRKAQTEEVVGKDVRASIVSLRRKLANIESISGLSSSPTESANNFERNTAQNALSTIQRGLTADEALLSFHVGGDVSALWAVTKQRVELYRLAPETKLSQRIADFRGAVRRHRPDRDRLGELLYQELFGSLSQEFQQKRDWVISAEDSFFEIPLAALVVGRGKGRPVYLVEKHTIVHTPSAAMLSAEPRLPNAGTFVGVGDGIYNGADERWKGSQAKGLLMAFAPQRPAVELARLAGSLPELQACAYHWTGGDVKESSVLLTGQKARRVAVRNAVNGNAEVVHIAAHFMVSPDRPLDALIDLGLADDGQPELMNEKDVAALQAKDATVVMSGCSSGDTKSLVTSGVLGLTRAWLIAGARAVIGASWPVADDTGELFGAFYSNLRERRANPARMRAVSASLQAAQIAMLRTNSWRSDPAYWGAFYVVGKD